MDLSCPPKYSADRERVQPIVAELQRRGAADLWFDQWDIAPGDHFIDKLNEGIETGAAAVVFFSEASLRDSWQKLEIDAFHHHLAHGKRILLVRLDGVQLPALLRSYSTVAPNADAIEAAIRNRLGRPEPAPPSPKAATRRFEITLTAAEAVATLDGAEVARGALRGGKFAYPEAVGKAISGLKSTLPHTVPTSAGTWSTTAIWPLRKRARPTPDLARTGYFTRPYGVSCRNAWHSNSTMDGGACEKSL